MKSGVLILLVGTISTFVQASNPIKPLLNLIKNSDQSETMSSWKCPQESYPQIHQLRVQAEVKIEIRETAKGHKLKLHPDIFKVNPFTIQFAENILTKHTPISLDYSTCINEFIKSTEATIKKNKQEQCREQNPSPLCRLKTEEILKLLDENIASANYFKKHQDQVTFPRLLPGSTGKYSSEDARNEIKNFINTEIANSEIIFSKEGMNLIAEDEIIMSKERLQSLEKKLLEYNQKLKNDACKLPGRFCESVSTKLDQSEHHLKNVILAKIKVLDFKENIWKQQLSMPDSEEEATTQMKSEMEKNPFNCSFMFKPYSSGKNKFIATRFPGAISKNLDRLKEVADFNCLDETLQNYASAISMASENSNQFKNYCKETNSETCKQAQKRLSIMEDNLRRLFNYRYSSLGERYLNEQNICLTDPKSENLSIRSFLEQNRKAITCMELKPGEHKVVSFKDGNPTGISGNYALKKTAPDQHEIIVGINVTTLDSKFSSQEMFSRIQSCMKNISPYMKGPQGEKLDFKIMSKDEIIQLPASLRPPINSINIQDIKTRSHAGSYAADIDCPTISHEILHLLGLCDEYNGHKDGYTCRVVAKVPSLMKDPSEAFKEAVDETINCKCTANSTCDIISKYDDPQLKSLYLQPTLPELMSMEDRNRFCRSQFNRMIKMSENQETERAKILEKKDHFLKISTISFIYGSDQLSQDTWECSCKVNDHECLGVLNNFENNIRNINNSSLNSCPYGTEILPSQYGERSAADIKSQWTDQGFKIFRKAKSKSLLLPNHFKRITGGACDKASKDYDECAQWAYRNESSIQNCKDRPLHCEDGKTFLGITQ